MKTFFWLILGTALMALALNLFLIPEGIAAGGVSGVATILEVFLHIRASVTVLILNIPILLLALLFLSKRTFFLSLLGTGLLSFFLEVFSMLHPVTHDKILCAIAGGILLGLGMGLVFRADATTGGTDIVAMLLQKKNSHLPIGTLVLIADGVVIVASGILFKSFEAMLYAVLALSVSSTTIDKTITGGDAAKQLTVISPYAPDIARNIMQSVARGVTGIRSIGLYSGKESLMLMTVVKKNQIVKVKNIVKQLDKNAFVIVSDVTEVIGEGFK